MLISRSNQYSFTLIELLVVVAIISTLSALFLPNFMAARERARDSQRKSDLKQIQKAIEMYRQDNRLFPTAGASNTFGSCGSSFAGSGSTVYMNKVPCDPIGPTPYYYLPDNSTMTYALCTCIENKADSDAANGNCSAAVTCSQSKNYTVNQP